MDDDLYEMMYGIYSPEFCSTINSLCKTEAEEDAVWDFITGGMI